MENIYQNRSVYIAIVVSLSLIAISLCVTYNSLQAQVVEGVDYSACNWVNQTFDLTRTDVIGQRFPSGRES